MFKNIKKQTLLEIASQFLTTEKMLETTLCYVREEGETNTITYLATSNPEIAIEVASQIEGVGIDLGLDLGWALNEYDACMAESDGLGKCIIRTQNTNEATYVDSMELDLECAGVTVVPASEIVKKHSDISKALKAEKVLITYCVGGRHEILHTSLSNKSLFSWVYNGSGREVYQVQQYFEQGNDIGVIMLPDLDAKYLSYRRINLLDVVKVEVIE